MLIVPGNHSRRDPRYKIGQLKMTHQMGRSGERIQKNAIGQDVLSSFRESRSEEGQKFVPLNFTAPGSGPA